MLRLLFVSRLVLASAFVASASQAVPILPGDLLVTVPGINTVVRAEPPSGATVVHQGASGEAFSDIAIGEDGRIFVIGGQLPAPGGIRVSEIDPTSDSVRVVTQIAGVNRFGIAIEDAGSLLITDSGGRVLRIDPDSGASSTVTAGGNLVTPTGIVLDDLGDIYLADSFGGGGGGPTGQIIHVDHVSGAQTVVSSGGLLSGELRELVFDENGDLLVVDASNDSVVRIDTATGAQSLLSSGFADPRAIGFDATGRLLVGDREAHVIFEVDAISGAQTTYWNGPDQDFNGFAFFPIPEPGTALLVSLGLIGMARRRG